MAMDTDSEKRATGPLAAKVARRFLAEYCDEEISKRLYFDWWADRQGYRDDFQRLLWREVLRMTRVRAAKGAKRTPCREANEFTAQ